MDSQNIEFEGQVFHPEWNFKWMDVAEIPPGSYIVPVKTSSEFSKEFADLHLINQDLDFALKCLIEAESLGLPDAENIVSKALIYSGVVAYARAFSTGVRSLKLTPEIFKDIWSEDRKGLHSYLFELRQRHIAHSVNDFERCTTVGVIVTTSDWKRQEGVTGVGVTILSTVGLTKEKLIEANAHIEDVINYVNARIDDMRSRVHSDFKRILDAGGHWEPAPMVTFPNSDNIAERRRT